MPQIVVSIKSGDGKFNYLSVEADLIPHSLTAFDPGLPGIMLGRDIKTKTLQTAIRVTQIHKPNAEQLLLAMKTLPFPREHSSKISFVAGRIEMLVAKIAHCYAIAKYGLGSFESTLSSIVSNSKYDEVWHYVGSNGGYFVGDDLTSNCLSIAHRKINGESAIVVYAQLFPKVNSMVYQVVVGWEK